jgi:hypothetical protein
MQAVVDPSGPTVVGFAPSNAVLMGDFQNFVKVDYPLEMEAETLGVTYDSESQTYSFVSDPAKVAQKTADQWTQVRAQQRDLLYKSDWTCSVTDYEVPNRDAWVQYRAQLREVTTQADPFAIVWPVRPTA